jgi:hypothetical protein
MDGRYSARSQEGGAVMPENGITNNGMKIIKKAVR